MCHGIKDSVKHTGARFSHKFYLVMSKNNNAFLSCFFNRRYYIDKSVLVENRPLVKFIRNYIRESSGVGI